jgi:hypothetical protein
MRTRWTLGTAGCVFSTAILAWVPPALAGNATRPPSHRPTRKPSRGRARARSVASTAPNAGASSPTFETSTAAPSPASSRNGRSIRRTSLRAVAFLDGTGQPLCRSGKVVLVSSPDVPRVVVCPGFARLERDQPRVAESLVIHELLHTLGLGENPPSPAEITGRVEARCR